LSQIAAHTAFIDYRLPWAIAFFFLAGVIPDPHYARLVHSWAAGFGILTVARVALISLLWLRWEPTLAAIDQALSLSAGAQAHRGPERRQANKDRRAGADETVNPDTHLDPLVPGDSAMPFSHTPSAIHEEPVAGGRAFSVGLSCCRKCIVFAAQSR
jgi:hypothetical protein